MQLVWTRTILGGAAILFLLSVSLAGQQAQPAPRPPLSHEVFKNVVVLRGIPADEFLATMGFFSSSLNLNCTDCHVEASLGDWARFADDVPRKQTARRMILMTAAINKTYFQGRSVVTCYSCHRFSDRPKVIPNLAELYGSLAEEDPEEILQQTPDAPSPESILDKYIEALGGAQRLATVTSVVATGTQEGYIGDISPVEIYAKAPTQRATVVHTTKGDSVTTYDGRAGWIASPSTETPVPLYPLVGTFLDAARVEAELSFPGRIKEVLTEWRVGWPFMIDGRDVWVVQGRLAPGTPQVKLYFDKESGLLTRLVRHTASPVGLNPTQIDYADYRDVSGVKMPFRWVVSWTDGQSTIQLDDVRLNVPIADARFARPAQPAPVAR